MSNVLIILACLIPTAAYVGIIYWVDRYEKEPIWLLSATFLWGAIPSILVAIILNELLSIPFTSLLDDSIAGMASAAFIAPIVEETAKGAALLGIVFLRRRDIDSPLDGIIYGAMVGLGFAMVENYFYFSNEFASGGLSALGVNVFFRAFVFGLNHALFSAVFGLALAYARLSTSDGVKMFVPISGWVLAVTLHATHNATVGLSSTLCFIAPIVDWGGIILTITIIVWALRQEQRWLTRYLREEVLIGTLTFRQYEMVHSLRERQAITSDLLAHWQLGRLRRTRQFLDLCGKLASLKHHADLHPDDNHIDNVNELRTRIYRLGQQL